MNNIRIFSLNTRGLRNKLKRRALFALFKEKRFDIICLQETHVTRKEAFIWEKEWGGRLFYNSGSEYSKGEIILMSKHFQGEITFVQHTNRVLIVSVKTQSLNFTIANVYAPNDSLEKRTFFNTLQNLLQGLDTCKLAVLGDFNTAVDKDLDIISGSPHNQRDVNKLKEIITMLDLTDSWRVFNENEKEYTWCRHNPFTARRIDYAFLGEELHKICVSSDIMSVPHTDHRGLLTELCINNFIRGPGYWRFNNSFLKDQVFVQQFNDLIEKYINESKQLFANEQHQWD